MNASYVFGYGSLVNPATHSYAVTYPAKLPGWRRVWRHTKGRQVAFLTVSPSLGDEIDGLVAQVAHEEWHSLNERERWYLREQVSEVQHTGPSAETYVYHAPSHLHDPAPQPHPILLSYIDVVVQGYIRAFGPDGVARFFETTDGWDTVLDDRNAPRYARHQALTQKETALTDTWLAKLGVRMV